MKKIKILYIQAHSDKIAGAELCLLNLIKRIDRNKFEPIVLLYNKANLADALEELGAGVIVKELGTISRSYNPIRLIRFMGYLISGVYAVCRIIRKHKVDIIHCNQNVCIFYAVLAGCLTGAKCIWHVRNRVSNFGIIGTLLYRLTYKVICVSDSIKSPFVKTFSDAKLKVQTIYDGFPEAEETTDEMLVKLKDEFCISGNNKIIGTVGRITRWKGQDCFLRAGSILVKKYPDLKIVIVGDCAEGTKAEYAESNKFKKELRNLAVELGLSANVIFTGFREDAWQIIKFFDVFVLPSIEEPFGMVLLEAMLQGAPIVATNAGGVPEIIDDGREGFLVVPGQPWEMADAIEKILVSRETAKMLTKNAFKKLHDKFCIKTSIENMESIYAMF